MAGRKLAADVHVIGEDGQAVVLPGGTKAPKWALEQITNPACFVDENDEQGSDEAEAEAAAKAQAATDAAAAEAAAKDADAAAAQAAADAAAAQVQADADAKAAADAKEAAEKAAAEAEAAKGAVDYASIKFPELQALVKSRGLSAAGNTETLIARLEADDRDKSKE